MGALHPRTAGAALWKSPLLITAGFYHQQTLPAPPLSDQARASSKLSKVLLSVSFLKLYTACEGQPLQQ